MKSTVCYSVMKHTRSVPTSTVTKEWNPKRGSSTPELHGPKPNQDLILKSSLRASSDKMDSPFSLKLMSHFIRHGQLTHPGIRSMAE